MLKNEIKNNINRIGLKKITKKVSLFKIFFFVLILFSIFLGTHYLKKNSFTCNPDKNSVVVVLVDGADWRIIDHLIEKEKLPTFKSLINGGSRGTLYSITPYSTPNNISIFTGVLPSKHNITTHFYFDEDARQLKQSSLSEIKAEPIWKTLEESRCFSVISFVEIPTAFKINNVVVGALSIVNEIQKYNSVDLIGRSILNSLDIFNKLVYPSNLFDNFDFTFLKQTKDEMASKGMYLKFNSPISERMSKSIILALKSIGNFKGESDLLIDGIEKVFKSNNSAKFIYDYDALTKNIAVNLLENKTSDVYFIYFMGTDTFGHMYYADGWHIDDINNSQDQIFKYYEVMDSYLSELVEAAGKDSTFMVLSDHGIQDVAFDNYEMSIKNYSDRTSEQRPITPNPPHTAEAVFIASGPNIAHNNEVYGEMVDIVPTIYCILNTSFNKNDYDGEILGGIFTEEYKLSSGCKMGDDDRKKFLDWSKNKPNQFLHLDQKDKEFLYAVVSTAVDDYNKGIRPRYVWRRYTFSKNIIFVTLQSEEFKTSSFWTSRENIAQGVYDSTYTILEKLNLNGKDMQSTITPGIRILYNQSRVTNDFILGHNPIGIVEESGGYIYYNTSFFKENNYSLEQVLDALCDKRNLSSGCSSDQPMYYWDIVKI